MRPPSLPDRLFARWYDRLTSSMEKQHFGLIRARLITEARGDTLEISVGTGANLPYYPQSPEGGSPAPSHRIFLDSSLPMLWEARSKGVRSLGSPVQGSASCLPFGTHSFDTVVVTLVLCSVPEYAKAIREIHRVLRTDGRLIVLEHVRSDHPFMRKVQQILTPLWKYPARGCHLDRPTGKILEEFFCRF
ncbi:MAG: class I SAM-dependent methyltransferase [Leptospirales bacterium]